jgi:diaminobutyrate-2-oxoglutarate transaminase
MDEPDRFLALNVRVFNRMETDYFSKSIQLKSQILEKTLQDIQTHYPELNAQVRGIGLIYGLDIPEPEIAQAIAREAFRS